MPTVLPDCEAGAAGQPGGGLELPGCPWTVRLAGARSGCPALELYEAGVLVDVISSTRIAARTLRGARVAVGQSGPRALAWGRMPSAGACPYVEFGSRGRRRPGQAASVLAVVHWCWIAVADGDFSIVTVRSAEGVLRLRPGRGQPWC